MAVVSGGSSRPGTAPPPAPPSCCSHFLLGSLSPSSESHSQRLLPHKHQLPGQGGAGREWAGAPNVATKGQGSPHPPLRATLYSQPIPKSPAD